MDLLGGSIGTYGSTLVRRATVASAYPANLQGTPGEPYAYLSSLPKLPKVLAPDPLRYVGRQVPSPPPRMGSQYLVG